MEPRNTLEQRSSDSDQSKRDIPSFIEPRPPLILNPFMRPRPQKGTNLLELFEEDLVTDEPELVQVYLRIKPCKTFNKLYEIKSDKCLITSVDTATVGHGRRTIHNVSKMFTFSHIFGPDSTQKEIFDHVVKDNLRKLPEGHNFTLLSYGPSGSGKTYTLMGTVATPGLVPRSLDYVFRVVDAAQIPVYKPDDNGAEKLSSTQQEYELQWVKKLRNMTTPITDKFQRMSLNLRNDMTASSLDISNRTKYYVWVSFIEIYNEAIYDLLESTERRATSKLRIREDASGNVYVKGARQVFVRSGAEAYDVLVAGKQQLQVAATGVHAHSSRSHAVCTITMLTETGQYPHEVLVAGKQQLQVAATGVHAHSSRSHAVCTITMLTETENGVRTSTVRLCDLAGCERARRTKNTGARMAESRSINTSLHVLERCLHVLRRNQARTERGIVPYRESKLTRLLGAGLSGSRGEAVSMVVTLNPAPEYLHETRHVLTLAAQARNIQVNNTIPELSTFESTQDSSTMSNSGEILHLRVENERLHFELLQAQSHNRELRCMMERRRQEAASTMQELVEEAKLITKQYYEDQINELKQSHAYEIEDLIEEYEKKLNNSDNKGVDTPSRLLKTEVTQLLTKIAVLEDDLAAERLARARAEEELQHLRACIEERDEKSSNESQTCQQNDEMESSEEESGDESSDPCNESLEPTFKKEDLQRSRMQMLNASIATNNETVNNTMNSESDEDSVVGANDTLMNQTHDVTVKDTTCMTEENEPNSKMEDTSESFVNSQSLSDFLDEEKEVKSFMRGTYYVEGSIEPVKSESRSKKDSRETYCVQESVTDPNTDKHDDSIIKSNNQQNKDFVPSIKTDDSLMERKCLLTKDPVNTSYEQETTTVPNDDDSITENKYQARKDSRETYCVQELPSFASLKLASKNKHQPQNDSKETLSVTKSMLTTENSIVDKVHVIPKHETEFDSPEGNDAVGELNDKILFRAETKRRDCSLAQFEKIEKATKSCEKLKKVESEVFDNIKILKEPRHYFNEPSSETCDEFKNLKILKEKRTFFDNIDQNITSQTDSTDNKCKNADENSDDFRSPSIVKDDVPNDYEPTTIKKFLGNSFTKISDTVHKKNSKKHDSVDIFEGFDSPRSMHAKVKIDFIENARKSIEKLVLEQTGNNNSLQSNQLKCKIERPSTSCTISRDESEEVLIKHEITDNSQNNTVEVFENLYNNMSAPRATEFELLVSQEESTGNVQQEVKTETESKAVDKPKPVKYNLRHKTQSEVDKQKENCESVEPMEENEETRESKARTVKRNLRLRRRKKNEEENSDQERDKLKDIVNLQKEFSDVTLNVPAPVKQVKDIPSPEKVMERDENFAENLVMQSCPSKSVQRSRRKLFTPRPEPLEESLSQSGDSNERIRVPRPSYHRTRVRRKL